MRVTLRTEQASVSEVGYKSAMAYLNLIPRTVNMCFFLTQTAWQFLLLLQCSFQEDHEGIISSTPCSLPVLMIPTTQKIDAVH